MNARLRHTKLVFGPIFGLIMLLLLLFLSTAATAAVEITEQQVTVAADYSSFNGNTDTLTRTVAVTLQNTDTANASTVQVSVTGLPSGYPTPSTTTHTVGPGSTLPVQISLTIPHAQDSGNVTIGTIAASVNGVQQDTAPLLQETKSMLQFEEVTVEYTDKDGDDQSDDFSSGDTQFKLRDEVRPGTEVKVTFRLENLFDRDYDDGKLDNLELTFEVDDDDLYKNDVDEDYDLDDLDGEKSQEFTVTFTVDDEADEQEYEFTIKAEGEDDRSKKHTLERKMLLTVERAKNDVRITEAVVSPGPEQPLTNCAGSTASLQVKLKNFGSKDQSSAALAVFNPQLSLNQQFTNLIIDEFDDKDNSVTKTATFSVAGKNPGTYPIELHAFIRGDEEMDSKRIDLVVGECAVAEVPAPATTPSAPAKPAEEQPITEESAEEVPTLTAPIQEQAAPAQPATTTPLSSAVVVETVENPYTQQDFLLGMTIVAIAIVVGLIIVFLVILLKR